MDDNYMETKTIVLEKSHERQGFGIAISGGKDNPHFKTGSTAIVVSDIVPGSPADRRLLLNDQILSVNSTNVKDVAHTQAVTALKNAGMQVTLVIRRHVAGPVTTNGTHINERSVDHKMPEPSNRSTPNDNRSRDQNDDRSSGDRTRDRKKERREQEARRAFDASSTSSHEQVNGKSDSSRSGYHKSTVQKKDDDIISNLQTVVLEKGKTGYGFAFGAKTYVRELAPNSPADVHEHIEVGDAVIEINGQSLDKIRSIDEAIEIVKKTPDRVTLLLQKKAFRDVSHGNAPEQRPTKKPKPSRPPGYDPQKQQQSKYRTDETVVETTTTTVVKQETEKTWRSPDQTNNYDRDVKDGNGDVTKDSWDAVSPQARFASVDVSAQPNMPAERIDDRLQKMKMDTKKERRKSQGGGDTHTVTFNKAGSLGIQVAGGNAVGIFVAAVREDSSAAQEGLKMGDQILMANGFDFEDITREEAVLLLLALNDEITLLVEPRMTEFEKIRNELGDNFLVRVNFDHYVKSNANELIFHKGEIFNVRDTMYQGLIGYWQAQRVGKNGQLLEHGVLPNKSRAEQMAIAQRTEEKMLPKSPGRKKFQRRGSTGSSLRKYKFTSMDKLDEASFSEGFQIPAYERVCLRRADFIRPVVILGPVADLARLRLIDEMPERFQFTASSDTFRNDTMPPGGYDRPYGDAIKMREIRDVVAKNKHCLLDITPEGIEMLMYTQLCPIVILLKSPSKPAVKDMRQTLVSDLQRSVPGISGFNGDPLTAKQVRRNYNNTKKLEEFYPHLFTAKINTHIAGGPANSLEWFYKLKQIIFHQQAERAWMPEEQPDDNLIDDMVLSAPNYLSYVSGGESDTEGESVCSEGVSGRDFDDEPINSPQRSPTDDVPPYRPPARDPIPLPREERKPRYEDDGDGYAVVRDERQRNFTKERHDDRRVVTEDRRDERRSMAEERHDDRRPMPEERRDDRNDRRVITEERREVTTVHQEREVTQKRDPPIYSMPHKGEPSPPSHRVSPPPPAARRVSPPPPPVRVESSPVDHRPSPPPAVTSRYSTKIETEEHLFIPQTTTEVHSERIDVLEDEPRDETTGYMYGKRPETPDDIPALKDPEYELPSGLPSNDGKKKPPNAVKVYPTEYSARDARHSLKRTEVKRENTVSDSKEYEDKLRMEAERLRHVEDEKNPVLRDLDARVGVKVSDLWVDQDGESHRSRTPERPPAPRNYITDKRRGGQSQVVAMSTYKPSRGFANVTRVSFSPDQAPAQQSYNNREYSRNGPPQYGYEKRQEYNMDRPRPPYIGSDAEDEPKVVATARGIFDERGGLLESTETGVSIFIPSGALPAGEKQEIYFKVCQDGKYMPPLDSDNGETLLSPLVMCGPHGLKFRKPIELRLPHKANTSEDMTYSLKSSSDPIGDPSQWKNVKLGGRDLDASRAYQVTDDSVSVLVDYF